VGILADDLEGEGQDEMVLPGRAPAGQTPQQKLIGELDDLIDSNDVASMERFLDAHPEINLNEVVSFWGEPATLINQVARGLQALISSREGLAQYANNRNLQDEERAELLKELHEADAEIAKRVEILKRLTARGADPSTIKIDKNDPYFGKEARTSEVSQKYEDALTEALTPSSGKRAVLKSDPGAKCALGDFASGVQEFYTKLERIRQLNRRKNGEMIHLFSSTDYPAEDPACRLTFRLRQRLQGGIPVATRIEHARFFDGSELKPLSEKEFESGLKEPSAPVANKPE
jgi:hypothetical protein